jgi:hypothetical protein
MTTDPRVHELWLARDYLRDHPTGYTQLTKTKIRRLERELRDEGVDTETRPTEAQGTSRRWVVHVEGDPHDLGSAQVTHADRHCVVCERYPGCVREATAKEVDKMDRCRYCG